MDRNSNATKRRWQAAAFALVGLALLIAALQIIFTIPRFDPWLKDLDEASMEATITKLPAQTDSECSLVMNLESGSIYRKTTLVTARTAESYPAENKRIVFTRIKDGVPLFPVYPFRYALVSTVSPNESPNHEAGPKFEFPVPPTWLTDSVFVGRDSSKIYSIDALSNVRSELLQQFKGRRSRVLRFPNLRRFVSVTCDVPSPKRSNGQTQFAEVFEVDSAGQLKLLQTIELHDEFAIEILDGKICYVKRDARAITLLDPNDLSLQSELSFPEEIAERINTLQKSNMGTCSITLRDQVVSFLFADQEHCHYLLPEMKRVATTDKFTYAVPIKGNESLLGLGVYEQDSQDLVGLKVIDLANMRELWSRKIGNIQQFGQRDGQWIFTTAKYGFTVDVLDVQSGKVLFHRAPFASLTWVLSIVLPGSVIWSWQLIRWSNLSGASSWVLAGSLSALFIGLLVTHWTYWGGDSMWGTDVMLQYIQGYFVAALSVASAWIVWGKGRWLFRCLPLFVLTVFLIVLARWMHIRPSVAASTVGPTLAMCSLALPVFCIMHWLGLGRGSRTAVPSGAKWRMPLRDLFIISSIVAALLAVALPLAPGIRFDTPRPQFIVECVIAECLLLLGFGSAVVCYFKRWDTASFITLVVLILLITFEALYPFITGQTLFFRRSELPMVLFRMVSSSVLLFNLFLRCCLGDAMKRKLAHASNVPA